MEIKDFLGLEGLITLTFLLFNVFDTTILLKAHGMDLLKNTEVSNRKESSRSELMSELH